MNPNSLICNWNVSETKNTCGDVVLNLNVNEELVAHTLSLPSPAEPVRPPPLFPTPAFLPPITGLPTSADEGFIPIPSGMMLDRHQDGCFFFGTTGDCNDKYVGKAQDRDGHILIHGGPGSGKTSELIITSLGTWKGHIIVVDVKPKGDLLPECERLSRLSGKELKVFNPLKADSCGYDPFAFIRSDGKENLARNAKDLAISLIDSQPDNLNPVWVKSAQNLLAGVIVHHIDIEATFSETMTAVQLSSVKDLIKEINEKGSMTAKILVSKLKGLKSDMLASIGMDLTDLAILAADPLVDKALSGEGKTIDWNELNTATAPFNVVLQLPEENLAAWEPLTRLLINQLIRTLQRRSDKHTPEGKVLPPVLIMLDEFDSLGKIPSIKAGLSTLRNRDRKSTRLNSSH